MLLLESGRAELRRGDILKLPEGRWNGPVAPRVHVMVLIDHNAGSGMSLVWVSGYDAGDIWFHFPASAKRDGAMGIDMQWLKSNWSQWFAYEWKGEMRVMDIKRVELLGKDQRTIVEKS